MYSISHIEIRTTYKHSQDILSNYLYFFSMVRSFDECNRKLSGIGRFINVGTESVPICQGTVRINMENISKFENPLNYSSVTFKVKNSSK